MFKNLSISVIVIMLGLWCVAVTWMNLWDREPKIEDYNPDFDPHEHIGM
jgi:hypothetical protein